MSQELTRVTSPTRVVLVGAGHMGSSHGRALAAIAGFDLVGIVTRGNSGLRLAGELDSARHFSSLGVALAETEPDAVVIASFADTHVPFAHQALDAGCHVFVEKPLAPTVAAAEALICKAKQRSKALVVGYILRHHPSWKQFVELSATLGKPLVMRMNLNQQSSAEQWRTHQAIMQTTSPLVDCGVHYVDVMSQMTGAKADTVYAIGARLSADLPAGMYNYGQLQVTFVDGSVGWYEAGWGPMMSENAFFIKDVIGPGGALSIESGTIGTESDSSNVEGHTRTNRIRHHHARLDHHGQLARPDDVIDTREEPDHDELCKIEQEWFLAATLGTVTVDEHLDDVVESLRIVLAADESIRTGAVVSLRR